MKLMNRICAATLVALLITLSHGSVHAASQPAVIKPYGMAIPSFFFPASEQRARDACADNLPTCRASVRAQMEHEMTMSLIIPWALVAGMVLYVLIWLRTQEKKKQKAALAARARHNPGSFRKLDRDGKEKSASTDDDTDDDL